MRKLVAVAVAVFWLEVWSLTALLGGVQPMPPKAVWPLSADPECAAAMVRPPDLVFTDESVVAPRWVSEASFERLSEHDRQFVRISGFFHDSLTQEHENGLFSSYATALLPHDDPSGKGWSLSVNVYPALADWPHWREKLPSIIDRCVRVEGRLRLGWDFWWVGSIDEVRRLEVWSKPHRLVPPRR